jgi:hypothetical protein
MRKMQNVLSGTRRVDREVEDWGKCRGARGVMVKGRSK